MEKRGQVTIFIIVAVLIVAIVSLIYAFFPQIKSTFTSDVKNPHAFIEECLSDDLRNAVEIIRTQGGSFDPELFYMYQGDKLEYLCYTNEYYRTCTMQQPMLKEHIESGLGNAIADQAKICFEELKTSYQSQGYKVELVQRDSRVELLPRRIMLVFNNTLSLTKSDNTENYEQFKINFDSNIYEFIEIVQSILVSEATLGDTEIAYYMTKYRGLKVEKFKKEEGTKAFIVTDLDTEDKFQFATRSLAWPAGYLNDEI